MSTTTTAPPGPLPLAEMCNDGSAGDVGTRSHPDHPAPVPDGPGQHALLIRQGQVRGNLDLAPRGGYDPGSSAASEAKTVFVVCVEWGGTHPTGEMCQYAPTQGATIVERELLQSTTRIRVIEVRSGEVIGEVEVVPDVDVDCPHSINELYEPGEAIRSTVVSTEGVIPVEDAVTWMRAHLGGARYAP